MFSWPLLDYKDSKWDWRGHLTGLGWTPGVPTVFIFDEAQMTYLDEALWLNLFKSPHDYEVRAIAFASYGSAGQRQEIHGSPMDILPKQKITLRPIEHGDGLPAAGILFTKQEYDELIAQKVRSTYRFDKTFYDGVFAATEGHIGAIHDFIETVGKSQRGARHVPLVAISSCLNAEFLVIR